MNEQKFSKLSESKREIAEWRDGRGMFVIFGFAVVLVISFILTALKL